MPSEKQIKARENFVKNYAQKKKGSKSGKFKKSSSGFKPIPSSKLRKGTISHTMAIRAEGKKKTKSGNKVMARLQKLKIKVVKKNAS